ncbi:MAG: hypothetical protein AAF205_00320 [Pseudomonadota bacterium]
MSTPSRERETEMTGLDQERSELRALIDTMDKPTDPRIVRRGYGDLSSFLQNHAATN